MKNLKECFAVNESEQSNIKIFNMDTNDLILLNEEASLYFLNREKDMDSIKKIFTEQYDISNEGQLEEDLNGIKAYFEENFYG